VGHIGGDDFVVLTSPTTGRAGRGHPSGSTRRRATCMTRTTARVVTSRCSTAATTPNASR
jgi:hypothetical protein